MNKEVRKEVKSNSAFIQYVGAFIGLMIVCIIAVSVAIPTVQDALDTANFTGTVGTVTDQIPLLMAVSVILLVVASFAVIK